MKLWCVTILLVITFMNIVYASSSTDLLRISDVKDIYIEAHIVELTVQNISDIDLLIVINYEKYQSDDLWRSLPTVNKSIRLIELNPSQKKIVKWKYWENIYTYEDHVSTGIYRCNLTVKNSEGETLKEFYTEKFTITRE